MKCGKVGNQSPKGSGEQPEGSREKQELGGALAESSKSTAEIEAAEELDKGGE